MSRSITSHRYFQWLLIAALTFSAAALTGCENSPADSSADALDCAYDPVGIGSWGPGESLAEFSAADALIKGKVIGHSVRTDLSIRELLVNKVRISKVLRGPVAPGEEVLVSSGGGVCLENGDEMYLHLQGGSFVDGQQARVYYILHPYAQFPIKDGRVDVYDGFGPEDFVFQFQDMPEQELESQLRESLE